MTYNVDKIECNLENHDLLCKIKEYLNFSLGKSSKLKKLSTKLSTKLLGVLISLGFVNKCVNKIV